MSKPGRPPKRERKKQVAAERRAARLEYIRLQRKRRRILWLTTAVMLVAGGGLLAGIAFKDEAKPGASPKSSATPAPTSGPIACEASLPKAAGEKKDSYGKPEDQKLSKSKKYTWRLDTSCGTIDIELDVSRSPKTTNSIVFLTRKGFYDGLTFHRVAQGFVIQGGDPDGSGSGGPGYDVVEKPPKNLVYERGVVAMAKTGQDAPGTSGSQFYIVTGNASGLTASCEGLATTSGCGFALLGKVVAGIDIAQKIEQFANPAQPDGPPTARVFINKASIVEGTR